MVPGQAAGNRAYPPEGNGLKTVPLPTNAASKRRLPNTKLRPSRRLRIFRFGALICPAPRSAFANLIAVANGFDTTRPFESVTVGGPNRGSAALSRVTIGPEYGPDCTEKLVPS